MQLYIAITHKCVIYRLQLFCSCIPSQAEEYSSVCETFLVRHLIFLLPSCPVGIHPFIIVYKKRIRLRTFAHREQLNWKKQSCCSLNEL